MAAVASVHSLTPIESQRIIAVLEETLEKLSFLDSITPDVLAHRDELAQLVGDEISRIIYEQRTLEQRYEELIRQRGLLKGMSNKSKYKEIQGEIQKLSYALRESTKHLCRNLKDNPNIGENLLKIQKEREHLQDLIAKTIQELRTGTFHTLVTQVQEEKQQQEKLSEIVRREKETSAAVEQLNRDLEREQEEHKREMADKQASIRNLKEELRKIKLKTSVDGRCARMEAHAETDSKQRAFALEEAHLEEHVSALESKKATEERAHGTIADFLKMQQEELAAAIESWNQKLVVDVEAKDEELKQLKEQREQDLELLNALQARYDSDLAEAAKLEAESARKAELERLREEDNARKRVAATLIQRGLGPAFKAFQAAESGKKKKGKKGKGKKGKKK